MTTLRDALPGWEKRLLDYKMGKNAWAIPGHEPESEDPLSLVFPWPYEWVVAKILSPEERAQLGLPGGLLFEPGESEVSGASYQKGQGVRCVRCGVVMCEGPEANMSNGFSFPYCDPCGPEIAKFLFTKPNLL